MTYSLIANSTSIIRDADGAVIPADSSNGDYRAYLAWVALGNTATAAAAPPVVPTIVQMWQARAAMKAASYDPTKAEAQYQSIVAGKTNVLDAAQALIDAAGNPVLSAFWDYAATLQSNDATLATLSAQAGLSAPQVASLFAAAAALTL